MSASPSKVCGRSCFCVRGMQVLFRFKGMMTLVSLYELLSRIATYGQQVNRKYWFPPHVAFNLTQQSRINEFLLHPASTALLHTSRPNHFSNRTHFTCLYSQKSQGGVCVYDVVMSHTHDLHWRDSSIVMCTMWDECILNVPSLRPWLDWGFAAQVRLRLRLAEARYANAELGFDQKIDPLVWPSGWYMILVSDISHWLVGFDPSGISSVGLMCDAMRCDEVTWQICGMLASFHSALAMAWHASAAVPFIEISVRCGARRGILLTRLCRCDAMSIFPYRLRCDVHISLRSYISSIRGMPLVDKKRSWFIDGAVPMSMWSDTVVLYFPWF